jgi:hypothetical protein
MKGKFQLLPTSGAPIAGAGRPSIGRTTMESKRGPKAMNVRFENVVQEMTVETVEMREWLLDMTIPTLLFRARKRFGLLIVNFRNIRVADESVMRICGEESLEETWPDTITLEKLMPVKTQSSHIIAFGVIDSRPGMVMTSDSKSNSVWTDCVGCDHCEPWNGRPFRVVTKFARRMQRRLSEERNLCL